MARTPRPSNQGCEVIALAPTRAAVLVPANHRPASVGSTPLAAIDGERLLTWSPVGTPYTDLLVELCRRNGATVTAVESTITGAPGLVDLADLETVALVAEGGSSRPDSVELSLEPEVVLPLVAVVRAGERSPAVARLLSILTEPLSSP